MLRLLIYNIRVSFECRKLYCSRLSRTQGSILNTGSYTVLVTQPPQQIMLKNTGCYSIEVTPKYVYVTDPQ